ncbi:MAG: methylenetetrahydrofolate--tRNA-(uracil(54)-C(5))-methyltransferase (FADH(2)-oxidizing) TrmFO [Rhodospirillaceae bacterium]|nr:methylenetetrahydrofolate--tRNA-(uracil(54)-C(5))-methyltransferase (FADH(2)-oxidizing) TrmFO [Rhodospirillaceae bacterium]
MPNNHQKNKPVHVIGGGLAGCEAAWALATAEIPVILHEMRPNKGTPAHQGDGLAELVCSNSFRSDDFTANAVGVLHEEMRKAGSLVMHAAKATEVPAGGALAVDRDAFSGFITNAISENPLIEVMRKEITDPLSLDAENIIIATGPLTSDGLSQNIRALTGAEHMAFFDAIAPIVHKDSIDFSKAWFQSRYDKGDGDDYINLPMSKEQYDNFINDLINGEKVSFKEWEENTPYFEGCLPIEVMAARGPQTLSYGPMKPVGLTNPHDPTVKPNAIVQLRQDNKLGTLWNMVGFQTKLTYGEQKRIFKSIPGLESAEFARLGGLHRNTFIKSPELLDETLRLKTNPKIRFAGQITGCEGYVESSAMGIMAGRFCVREIMGLAPTTPPPTTAMGALLGHVTGGAEAETFQPMNINFGLFPPPSETRPNGRALKGRERKAAMASRALKDFDAWLASDL